MHVACSERFVYMRFVVALFLSAMQEAIDIPSWVCGGFSAFCFFFFLLCCSCYIFYLSEQEKGLSHSIVFTGYTME